MTPFWIRQPKVFMKILTLIRLMNITSTYAEVSNRVKIWNISLISTCKMLRLRIVSEIEAHTMNSAHIQFIYLINLSYLRRVENNNKCHTNRMPHWVYKQILHVVVVRATACSDWLIAASVALAAAPAAAPAARVGLFVRPEVDTPRHILSEWCTCYQERKRSNTNERYHKFVTEFQHYATQLHF